MSGQKYKTLLKPFKTVQREGIGFIPWCLRYSLSFRTRCRTAHQDFIIHKGRAIPFKSVTGKSTSERWSYLAPIFEDAVAGRTVLDMGANVGFFSLKALEYQAAEVTACEYYEDLIDIMKNTKNNLGIHNWNIVLGDFFNKKSFSFENKSRYDVVMLLGIVHTMLASGILKKTFCSYYDLFEYISSLTNSRILVEFVLPREKELKVFSDKSIKEEFTRDRFENALKHIFPTTRFLGRCQYHSGNSYGRYMYYGIK